MPELNIDTTKPVPEPKGRVKQFFHHPNFNVVAGLFGIIGVFLAIYFYAESIKEPNLMYYVSPTRTPIIQMGNLQNFSIMFAGTSIKSDVSGATVQIWNAGKQPVREEDVLKPITLSTAHGEPIYQITEASTRDVIGATCGMLNTPSTNIPSTFKIGWHILEHNDAIRIQLIYGGDVNVPLVLDGVVVGQKALVPYKTRSDTMNNLLQVLTAFSWVVVPICCLIFIDRVYLSRITMLPFTYKVVMTLIVIFLAALVVGTTYILQHLIHYGPPFPP